VKNRIGIQSMAAVTPLGDDPEKLWQALRVNQTLTDRGIIADADLGALRKRAAINAAALGFTCIAHASNPWDRAGIFCGIPAASLLDRSIELGVIACLQALAEAGWSASLCAQSDTALIVATSKGPILRMLEACGSLPMQGAALPKHLAWHIAMGPSALATVIAGIINPGGPVQTHVAACAGSMVAVQRAWQGIIQGEFKRAIVVAADASIDPLFEHSFENLGVFAKLDSDGKRRCRPFGGDGNGFFISEAAAAICVEAGDAGAVTVENCFLGADGTHLLALDAQGQSLERGLRHCAAQQDVAFIHAHAAGTHHDQVELAAIRRACGAGPAVFSHKRWMGHTLGASGLVGLVISAICHNKAQLTDGQRIAHPARSITISQGFGGHIGMCVLAG
jgi:3-oxoacyl-(acyl-carrier-protein) synthase